MPVTAVLRTKSIGGVWVTVLLLLGAMLVLPGCNMFVQISGPTEGEWKGKVIRVPVVAEDGALFDVVGVDVIPAGELPRSTRSDEVPWQLCHEGAWRAVLVGENERTISPDGYVYMGKSVTVKGALGLVENPYAPTGKQKIMSITPVVQSASERYQRRPEYSEGSDLLLLYEMIKLD